MFQQNENFGMMNQRINFDCRFCFIHVDGRDNLKYDVKRNDRFHHEIMRMKKKMNSMNKIQQTKYFRKIDLNFDSNVFAFFTIISVFDFIRTRSNDPIHSKYGGITKFFHVLFMTAILISKAQNEYVNVLRDFFYLSNWRKFQFPMHHLGSYELQKHVKWFVIISILLRVWLNNDHIQQKYFFDIVKIFKNFHATVQIRSRSIIDIIVTFFATVARFNTLLMSDSMTERDRTTFHIFVKIFRILFKQLLKTAIIFAQFNFRNKSATSIRAITSAFEFATSVIESVTSAHEFEQSKNWTSKKTLKYKQDQKRFNLHIGFHHENAVKHYEFSTHVNVLIGEDKHRAFKKNVYNINFVNVERSFFRRESMQQIIRLLLLKSFVTSESELIIMIDEFYQICFTSFDVLLFRFEQQQFEKNDDYLTIQTDDNHQKSIILIRFQVKYCKEKLNLPIRFSQLNDGQVRRLRKAYEIDYNMLNIMHFGTGRISWCKKLSLDDKYFFFLFSSIILLSAFD